MSNEELWQKLKELEAENKAQQKACPSCGYCPHCGRGHQTLPYYPTYPIYPVYPHYPTGPIWISQPTYTYGDTTGNYTITAQ